MAWHGTGDKSLCEAMMKFTDAYASFGLEWVNLVSHIGISELFALYDRWLSHVWYQTIIWTNIDLQLSLYSHISILWNHMIQLIDHEVIIYILVWDNWVDLLAPGRFE